MSIIENISFNDLVPKNKTYDQTVFEGTGWYIDYNSGPARFQYIEQPWITETVPDLAVITALGYDDDDNSIGGIIDGIIMPEGINFSPNLAFTTLSHNFKISNITKAFNKTDSFSTLETVELSKGSRYFGINPFDSTTKRALAISAQSYGVLYELTDNVFTAPAYDYIGANVRLGIGDFNIVPSQESTYFVQGQ